MAPGILADYGIPETDRGITVRDLLTVVFRRKRLLLGAIGCTALFTTGGAYLLEPGYRAEAQVYVQRERPATVDLEDDRLTHQVLTRSDVITSEVSLILSRGVVEEAVDALRLWERPTEATWFTRLAGAVKTAFVSVGLWTRVEPREGKILKLKRQLNARAEPDADVINIWHVSNDPALSADIVNAVVDAYLNARQASHETSERSRFFAGQVERSEAELAELDGRRAAIKQEWNIVEIEEEKRLVLGALTTTDNRLQEAVGDMLQLEKTYEQLAAETAQQPERVLVATETERSELYDDLVAMVARMEARQAEQLVKWPPDDPRVLEVTRSLEAVRARLAEVQAITPSIERHALNTVHLALLERQKIMGAELAGFRAKVQEFRAQRENQLERLLMLDARAKELTDLDAQIEIGREKRLLFLKRAEEARVQSESSPNFANVWVINRASVPQRPTLMRVFALVIGLGLGVALAAIFVATAEYFDHSIHNREDLYRHLDVPVLAAVPQHRD